MISKLFNGVIMSYQFELKKKEEDIILYNFFLFSRPNLLGALWIRSQIHKNLGKPTSYSYITFFFLSNFKNLFAYFNDLPEILKFLFKSDNKLESRFF